MLFSVKKFRIMRCKAGSSSTTRTHTWRSPRPRRFRSHNDVSPMPAPIALMSPVAAPWVAGFRIGCYLLTVFCPNASLPATAQSPSLQAGSEPITPIPGKPDQDRRRLVLGERLFGDTRLSHDDTHSCLSCHDIRTNGA